MIVVKPVRNARRTAPRSVPFSAHPGHGLSRCPRYGLGLWDRFFGKGQDRLDSYSLSLSGIGHLVALRDRLEPSIRSVCPHDPKVMQAMRRDGGDHGPKVRVLSRVLDSCGG